ncbi:MAG: DEAD/DEAH box helicase [Collinsella sp.]
MRNSVSDVTDAEILDEAREAMTQAAFDAADEASAAETVESATENLPAFDELGLSDEMLRAIENLGYTAPTPVQAGSIPVVLEGRDLLAAAQTGTGKTAAFLLPTMNNLEHIAPPKSVRERGGRNRRRGSKKPEGNGRGPVMLVITPTRELAQQIDEVAGKIADVTGHVAVTVVGGVSYKPQTAALKYGCDILVATPGRLVDLIEQGACHLDEVKVLVLDEADRMLDMGFIHDVTRILDKIPSRRNLGMFSATISREVMDISWVYQRDPEEITVRADEQNKPDILQYAVTVEQTDKVAAMARIIRQEKLERVMVFCNTKGMVERLTKYLEMEGLDAACIHGDIPQKKREQVMARFRRGELPVFVATDVAARGIDVDDVDAVFNYDVPQENEYYVHRIGRTGRAKRHGVAYTLVADYPSKMRLDAIAKFTGNDVKPAHFEGDTLVVDAK